MLALMRFWYLYGFCKFDEHSEQALAPHTNGPRDVPRCGALSLLQKTLHYRAQELVIPDIAISVDVDFNPCVIHGARFFAAATIVLMNFAFLLVFAFAVVGVLLWLFPGVAFVFF